MFVSNLMDVID